MPLKNRSALVVLLLGAFLLGGAWILYPDSPTLYTSFDESPHPGDYLAHTGISVMTNDEADIEEMIGFFDFRPPSDDIPEIHAEMLIRVTSTSKATVDFSYRSNLYQDATCETQAGSRTLKPSPVEIYDGRITSLKVDIEPGSVIQLCRFTGGALTRHEPPFYIFRVPSMAFFRNAPQEEGERNWCINVNWPKSDPSWVPVHDDRSTPATGKQDCLQTTRGELLIMESRSEADEKTRRTWIAGILAGGGASFICAAIIGLATPRRK